jgi:hypothetical protein
MLYSFKGMNQEFNEVMLVSIRTCVRAVHSFVEASVAMQKITVTIHGLCRKREQDSHKL